MSQFKCTNYLLQRSLSKRRVIQPRAQKDIYVPALSKGMGVARAQLAGTRTMREKYSTTFQTPFVLSCSAP
jgi:hypothetical protein